MNFEDKTHIRRQLVGSLTFVYIFAHDEYVGDNYMREIQVLLIIQYFLKF